QHTTSPPGARRHWDLSPVSPRPGTVMNTARQKDTPSRPPKRTPTPTAQKSCALMKSSSLMGTPASWWVSGPRRHHQVSKRWEPRLHTKHTPPQRTCGYQTGKGLEKPPQD